MKFLKRNKWVIGSFVLLLALIYWGVKYAPPSISCPLSIIYAPHCWNAPTVQAVEPDVCYRASYFDPCTANEIDLGLAKAGADGTWTPTFPPECHDWLLVMEASTDA